MRKKGVREPAPDGDVESTSTNATSGCRNRILMLSGGRALESYATERAKSVLSALGKRTPTMAHRKTDAGLRDISLDQIETGDTLVVPRNRISKMEPFIRLTSLGMYGLALGLP